MKTISTLAVVAVLLGPGLSLAQDAEKPSENAKLAATSTPKNAIAVKLHVTVSKYQSEKKVSSVPFTVSLTDNNIWNRIRAGARVPIPMATMTPNATGPTPYNYEQVGLSIDSRAISLPSGAFQVEMNASDTSVVAGEQATAGAAGAPVFRTISVASTTVLKDGQTTQLSTATDPISGLVMRVDVTLNVSK